MIDMKKIEIPKITDGRGNLSFFESERVIPFKINGVNLLNIYNTDDRYEFTNNKNTKFFFVALSGSLLFGDNSTDDFMNGVFLDSANKGVYIGENSDFTLLGVAGNTVALIISSTEKFNIRRI